MTTETKANPGVYPVLLILLVLVAVVVAAGH